ncbi:MAG: cation-translocating P-type ATPase [Chloroflexota bacterium]|nr:MAG: cation-translocating P-type ATPase [Chloroflexota bacterium]
MAKATTLEVPVRGMDCAECTLHVQEAIRKLPGVASVDVFLAAEKAVVNLDPERVDISHIRKAVADAGYRVPEVGQKPVIIDPAKGFTRQVLVLFGVVFAAVLFIVVAGEWFGLFESITRRVPLPVGIAIVLVAGYPVFKNVVRAAMRRQVIAHTLMSVGVLAALAIGEWATAAVVVFFMRVGDYAESFTTERARKAVKDLTALTPQTARLERDGVEVETPLEEVRPGETVVIRPGEKIPVDGEVISGQAAIDQAAITGEALPVDAGPGSRVYAATMVKLGSLRVRATHIGPDSTFGRVIRMVEQAEANRADVQRTADKFSAYYLPVVAAIALLTFILRRDPLSTAAVLVVACSCSFALATPIAMLASIGAGARRGLLIKGGKYLESLAVADIMLIDKTGTLTLGRPELTDIICADGPSSEEAVLGMAASAERYSEHPMAEAVRRSARERGIETGQPRDFENIPGMGVRAWVNGNQVTVGNRRMALEGLAPVPNSLEKAADVLESQGKTVLYVMAGSQITGLLAAADTLRPEVPEAITALYDLGIRQVELLTGDNEQTARTLVERLRQESGTEAAPRLSYRANVLPENKIEIVREYQRKGHTVVMVGDGINDAPALAAADVGIAMGAAGADVAIEAAHIALMREDWRLVPGVIRIARKTMRVVRFNIAFTTLYNVVGLSLAALGFLPPIFAAAAQSFPDIGILINSSRLLRQKET